MRFRAKVNIIEQSNSGRTSGQGHGLPACFSKQYHLERETQEKTKSKAHKKQLS